MAVSKSASSSTPSRAPESSPRPAARPRSTGKTAPVTVARDVSTAPVSSPRPPARPTDGGEVSREARERTPAEIGGLLQGLGETYGGNETNAAIAQRAESLVGTQFNPDLEAQCAAFVSDVLSGSGADPAGFRETVRARDFGDMGARRISSIEDLQPGDIVAFNNTYRFSQNEGDHTHVGIYAGDGQFIHRPTQSAGYQPGSAPGEVIKEDLQAYIDRDRGRFQASFAGGYRFE